MNNYKKYFILIALLCTCFIGFSMQEKTFSLISDYQLIRPVNFAQYILTKKDVLNRIKKVAAKQFSVKIETLNLQTSFVKDLKADDLDMVELVMAFEDEFKIKVPDDQLETLTTVQKAYDYLIKVMKVKK